MQLIPAIDLRNGNVVRLQQGDYDRETRYDDDPLEVAERYQNAGASLIHIVDLDSARHGGNANLKIIRKICSKLSIQVQTGGGVRSQADVEARLEAGAARVVVGSMCVREPDTFEKWIRKFGSEKLVAGLDVARATDGGWIPRAAGWTEAGSLDLFTLVKRFYDAGLKHLLCTDIERDGMYAGPSLVLYEALVSRYAAIRTQASGGIGNLSDLVEVSHSGVAACIVGRALLESKVPLKAIAQWSR